MKHIQTYEGFLNENVSNPLDVLYFEKEYFG